MCVCVCVCVCELLSCPFSHFLARDCKLLLKLLFLCSFGVSELWFYSSKSEIYMYTYAHTHTHTHTHTYIYIYKENQETHQHLLPWMADPGLLTNLLPSLHLSESSSVFCLLYIDICFIFINIDIMFVLYFVYIYIYILLREIGKSTSTLHLCGSRNAYNFILLLTE